MRILLLSAIMLLGTALVASADKRSAFHGTWGTPKQCSRAPIAEGGTLLAQPYEIDANWLKQGDLWCGLNWGPVETRKGSLFTAAHAQCGEDTLRDYFLGFELFGETLRLRWGFPQLSEPLARCPNS